jgi:hypothetical protein
MGSGQLMASKYGLYFWHLIKENINHLENKNHSPFLRKKSICFTADKELIVKNWRCEFIRGGCLGTCWLSMTWIWERAIFPEKHNRGRRYQVRHLGEEEGKTVESPLASHYLEIGWRSHSTESKQECPVEIFWKAESGLQYSLQELIKHI